MSHPPHHQHLTVHPLPSTASATTAAQAQQRHKHHRHSVAGQAGCLRVLGLAATCCIGPGGLRRAVASSANSLFSTAVISGSSSAPNLRDMIPSSASATAIEGFGGVPMIRPLETLHNALSLRQIDCFLDQMTTAPPFRTPSSTPPKYPSTPLPTPSSSGCSGKSGTSNAGGTSRTDQLKLQSLGNSTGWSGPPSFVSSSGPSSPGLSETSKESSEMSSSIISGDGQPLDELTRIFPNLPELDTDLSRVGMTFDSINKDMSGSIEFSEYYEELQRQRAESGEITPISVDSEAELNAQFDDDNNETLTSVSGKPLLASCNAYRSLSAENNATTCQSGVVPKALSPQTPNINVYNNLLDSDLYNLAPVDNSRRFQATASWASQLEAKNIKQMVRDISNEKEIPIVNVNSVADKWSLGKEKFMEKCMNKTDNIDFGKNLNIESVKVVEKETSMELLRPAIAGALTVKESYIEPPKISRVSKSFHGKSPTSDSYLDISNGPRRSSEGVPLTNRNIMSTELPVEMQSGSGTKPRSAAEKKSKPQFVTQLSQPCGSNLKLNNNQMRKTSLTEGMIRNPRFTTIRVNEEEHAASVGINLNSKPGTCVQDLAEATSSSAKQSSVNECSNSDTTTNTSDPVSFVQGLNVKK